MRAFVGFFVSLLATVGAMSLSDACHFIGSRVLKRRQTRCSRNMCYDGTWVELPGANKTLACDEARQMALSIIASAVPGSLTGKRKRVDFSAAVNRVSELFTNVLVPAVEDVLYRRSPLPETAIEAFAEIDRTLLQAASSWTSFTKAKEQWSDIRNVWPFANVVHGIIDSVPLRLETADARSRTQGPLVNFLLDLQSFDIWNFEPFRTLSGRDLVVFALTSRLGYRNAHPGEARAELLPLTPRSPAWYLSVSAGISNLRRQSMDEQTMVPGSLPRAIEVFLTRDPPRNVAQLSAWSLLDDQLVTELCTVHRDRAAVFLLANSLNGPRAVRARAAARFLRRCRESESGRATHTSLAASVLVAGIARDWSRNRQDLVLPDHTNRTDVIRLLHDSTQAWSGRPVGTAEQVLALLDSLMSGQLPDRVPSLAGADRDAWVQSPVRNGVFKTREELGYSFEFTMTTLGRLLGLGCKLGANMGRLHLPDEFLRLLFEDGPVDNNVPRQLCEAAYFVRQGASDVLGVLGFRVWDTHTFRARFQ